MQVELRNLPMSLCAAPCVSRFRGGAYTGFAEIEKELVNHNVLESGVWASIPDQIRIAVGSP